MRATAVVTSGLAAMVMLAGPAWAQEGTSASDRGAWRLLAAIGAALAVVRLGLLVPGGEEVERDIRGRLGS